MAGKESSSGGRKRLGHLDVAAEVLEICDRVPARNTESVASMIALFGGNTRIAEEQLAKNIPSPAKMNLKQTFAKRKILAKHKAEGEALPTTLSRDVAATKPNDRTTTERTLKQRTMIHVRHHPERILHDDDDDDDDDDRKIEQHKQSMREGVMLPSHNENLTQNNVEPSWKVNGAVTTSKKTKSTKTTATTTTSPSQDMARPLLRHHRKRSTGNIPSPSPPPPGVVLPPNQLETLRTDLAQANQNIQVMKVEIFEVHAKLRTLSEQLDTLIKSSSISPPSSSPAPSSSSNNDLPKNTMSIFVDIVVTIFRVVFLPLAILFSSLAGSSYPLSIIPSEIDDVVETKRPFLSATIHSLRNYRKQPNTTSDRHRHRRRRHENENYNDEDDEENDNGRTTDVHTRQAPSARYISFVRRLLQES